MKLTPRHLGFIVALLVAPIAIGAYATDPLDTLSPAVGTQPVTLTGGDTPATYQVNCSSNSSTVGASSATLLASSINTGQGALQSSGRPLRNRCFQNMSTTIMVSIGSSLVTTADYWTLGVATGPAAQYCTHNSGTYYCASQSATASALVNVIQETQSVP